MLGQYPGSDRQIRASLGHVVDDGHHPSDVSGRFSYNGLTRPCLVFTSFSPPASSKFFFKLYSNFGVQADQPLNPPDEDQEVVHMHHKHDPLLCVPIYRWVQLARTQTQLRHLPLGRLHHI